MNDIKIFENRQFGTIRTVKQNGEPWFAGKDVAIALGYSNPQKAIRDHIDSEDRTVNESFTVNGTAITLINESGLYSLILSSKLPTAKEFKRWVTSEVLPSIRKTGGYITGQEELSDADLMAKALLIAQKQIEQREQRINMLETANKKMLPDAEYGRSLQAKQGITTTSIAKEFGMSAVTLNKLLHDMGVQYRQSGQWYLYRKYQNRGLTTTRTDLTDRQTLSARPCGRWKDTGLSVIYCERGGHSDRQDHRRQRQRNCRGAWDCRNEPTL